MSKGFAVVTGTSRGIGEAIARALLERGWTVAGAARSAAAASLAGHPRYVHDTVDLADPEAALHWLREGVEGRHILGDFPRLALVNNAGALGSLTAVHRTAPADFLRTLALDLVTPATLTGRALRHWPRRPLRVVDLSSGAADQPYAGWLSYCASKSALRMAGRVIATESEEVEELRHPDFGLLSLAPNVIATRMQEELRQADFPRRARFQALHDEGRLLRPEQPAAVAVAFLEARAVPRFVEHRYDPARGIPEHFGDGASAC